MMNRTQNDVNRFGIPLSRVQFTVRGISVFVTIFAFVTIFISVSAMGQTSGNNKGGNISLGTITQSGIPGSGMGDSCYPTQQFRVAFGWIADGDLKKGVDAFDTLSKRAYKMGTERWLDSICYSTMIGECRYEMGDNLQSLACFEDALQLVIDNRGWMNRINYDATQGPQSRENVAMAPWGTLRQPAIPAKYNDVQIGRGSTDTEGQIERGGTFMSAHYLKIQPQEICYTTTLAIMRRAELLGAVSKYDSMTKRVVSALSNSGCPRNHWMVAWADIPYAAALVADGKDDQAEPILMKATLVAGQYLHPLSGLAYILLGDIALRRGDSTTAAICYSEATMMAFPYEDPVVLQTAFRKLSAIAIASGNPAGLIEALAWTRGAGTPQRASGGRDYHTLHVILALATAELAIDSGRPDEAAKFLSEAGNILGRRTIGAGELGVRHQFLLATLAWQAGDIAQGEQLLTDSIRKNSAISKKLFHLQTALLYSKTQSMASARQQVEIFRKLLTDPSEEDWLSDPLEAMTLLSAVNDAAYLHYFLATQNLSDPSAAVTDMFEVAEQIRRRRFYASLDSKPGGARLFSLRMLLEADPLTMTDDQRKSRTRLLAMVPEWNAASKRASELKRQISATGFATANDTLVQQRNAAAVELSEISVRQEAMLHALALRRVYAPLTFPPKRTLQEIQKSLSEGTAVLSYINMGGTYYAFLFNRDQVETWEVKNAAAVARGTTAFLRTLGLVDARKTIDAGDLKDPKNEKKGTWKSTAVTLGEAVTAGSPFDPTTDFQELVVVPDGLFWYVPFEALHYDFGNREEEPLVTHLRIRYVPTAALAMVDERPIGPRPTTYFVAGKMDNSSVETIATGKIFEKIHDAVPEAVRLAKAPFAAPVNAYKGAMERLLVWHDVANDPAKPGELVPTGFGRGKPGSMLMDWLLLPWGAPDVVAIPGFHSPAENVFKSASSATGQEFFLTSCAMMASGTRTIVLSRWKMGGESGATLMEEFLREIPACTAAQSWQRAVLLARESKITLDREPKIRLGAADDPTVAGVHPLFWAGYIVLDRGTSVVVDAAEENGENGGGNGDDGKADGEGDGDDAGTEGVEKPNAVDGDTKDGVNDANGETAENGGGEGRKEDGESGGDSVENGTETDESAESSDGGETSDDSAKEPKPKPDSKPAPRPFTSSGDEDVPKSYEDNISEEMDGI